MSYGVSGEPPRRRRFDPERLNTLVQTLAIIGAGAWGVYTFIYEARIKPSLEPPTVSVTTRLEKAGERDAHVAIRSTVTRKNVGQTGVRVLGLVYNVTGLKARFGKAGDPENDLAQPSTALDQVTAARGYSLSEPGTVILHQGVLFAGAMEKALEPSELLPGEEVSRDLIFYVDRTQHDFVRVEVTLAFTKADEPPVRLRLEALDQGSLRLRPDPACETRPEPCRQLKTTDFGTEFSLW